MLPAVVVSVDGVEAAPIDNVLNPLSAASAVGSIVSPVNTPPPTLTVVPAEAGAI